jgi:hypothetical protein
MALLNLILQTAHAADTLKQQTKRFKTGPYPSSIIVQDMNGDGTPEILTADRGRLYDPRDERPADDFITYLKANEPMEYQTQPQLRVGFGPYDMKLVRQPGKDNPDLLVANFMATRNRDITLMSNLGEHLFESIHFTIPDEIVSYTKHRDGDGEPLFPTPGISAVDWGDLNQDGIPDFVGVGWSSDILVVILGKPEGKFADPVLLPCKGGPRDIVVSDLNRDGRHDAAVVCYTSGEIVIFEGDGKGTLTPIDRFSTRGSLPHKILSADVNGDNEKDLLVSQVHGDDSVEIYFHGDEFEYPAVQELRMDKGNRESLEHEIRDMIVSDLNSDGNLDIALACFKSTKVYVLMSKGSKNKFEYTREEYNFKDGKPRAIAAGDINGDEKPDIAVALWDDHRVAILLGK